MACRFGGDSTAHFAAIWFAVKAFAWPENYGYGDVGYCSIR